MAPLQESWLCLTVVQQLIHFLSVVKLMNDLEIEVLTDRTMAAEGLLSRHQARWVN